jgi:hypothetical protein
MDGTDYYFALPVSDGNYSIGKTWSPQTGMKMSRLISVFQELIGNIISEKSDFESLEIKINSLIVELKE